VSKKIFPTLIHIKYGSVLVIKCKNTDNGPALVCRLTRLGDDKILLTEPQYWTSPAEDVQKVYAELRAVEIAAEDAKQKREDQRLNIQHNGNKVHKAAGGF
jgi:hypothetical protein